MTNESNIIVDKIVHNNITGPSPCYENVESNTEKIDSKPIIIDDFTNIPTKSFRPISNPAKNHIVFNALRETGLTIPQAAKVIGVTKANGYLIEKKKAKSILAPYTALAKKAIKNIVQGKPVGASGPPKCSDILTAGAQILDRVEPKINLNENKSLSINLDITADEREDIRRSLGLVSQ